ncbi:MAG: DUF559 domain-containing protein [Pirellulaceae bacterium]
MTEFEERDRRRQQFLESQGYTVARFTNEAVFEDVEAVAIALVRVAGLPLAEETRLGTVAALFSTLSHMSVVWKLLAFSSTCVACFATGLTWLARPRQPSVKNGL